MAKTILIAEDFDDDALVIQNVLAQIGVEHSICRVENGADAIAYLMGSGPYADRKQFPLPEILLLDLAMPRVTGFQVLEWIKTQPACQDILIVVLSGHHNLHDVQQAYSMGAHSFLFKPCNKEDVQNLLEWFSAHRPGRKDAPASSPQ